VSSSGARSPLGESIRLEQLERDPHALLAWLREHEPVSWVPALDGWLVTGHALALAVMRDHRRLTVEDPRFSTGVVVGPSMLSLDGAQHDVHRGQFAAPFRPGAVGERFAAAVDAEARRLLDGLAPRGGGELRRSLAGPLAAFTMTHGLGLGADEVGDLLGWYEEIVAGVTAITAGRGTPPATEQAFLALRGRLEEVIGDGRGESLLSAAALGGGLSPEQVIANAAVLLFGGIETTEGMIANAVLAVLARPDQLARIRVQPELLDAAIDESLRLEPAAAVVDRYATEETELDGVRIAAGDLVRVSITAANRDPRVFSDPDRFDLDRRNSRRHLAFAQGPHVCLGIHLARLEARTALTQLLARFPRLRLDPARPAEVTGLVFRKPSALHVCWEQPAK
jgi:cytochrome P450